jgi:hypothetical protein
MAKVYCVGCGVELDVNELLVDYGIHRCDQCWDVHEAKIASDEKDKIRSLAMSAKISYDNYHKLGDVEDWVSFAKKTGVGLRHQKCLLSNYEGDCQIVKTWAIPHRTENLLIQSTKSGNGKTHLAVGALKELNRLSSKTSKIELSCKFTTFSELMLQVRASFNKEGYTEEDFKKELVSLDALVIDDLGAEKVTEYALSFLYVIINGRYENMKPTIITTNLTGEEIVQNYGMRILSRLASGTIMKVDGADYRITKQKTEEEPKPKKVFKPKAWEE